MSTFSQRRAWAPPCNQGMMVTLTLHSGARITVDKRTVPVWRAVDGIMQRRGYRPRTADTGAYNCRQITGGSGYSLHAYGIAVDYNWQSNPYGSHRTDMPPAMVAEIERSLPVQWGGWWSTPDPMHFEVTVAPAQLAGFAAPEPFDWTALAGFLDPPHRKDDMIVYGYKSSAGSSFFLVAPTWAVSVSAAFADEFDKSGGTVVTTTKTLVDKIKLAAQTPVKTQSG